MSRHESRQKLALEFGATDIVTERGDEGVARIKDMTDGLGAHSVVAAVGTQEAMMQSIRATRPGGRVGFVLFGDVWERPGLSKRDRSLITVATLVALYRTNELPHHLKRALNNGVTRD